MATSVKLTRKVDGKTETFETDSPEQLNALLAQGWVADAKRVDKAISAQAASAK